ncbi:hypothetical protein HPB49_012044 [Dermacentor silvarum]|uniref:Uncharacterized protein n=1 Tax=Dermacentor silvarum TaxID=543639 RepID=A0ACB8DZZ5_DERSI|nr:hypothetical protein HPB49_012044 [Dermacentor silvarum]
MTYDVPVKAVIPDAYQMITDITSAVSKWQADQELLEYLASQGAVHNSIRRLKDSKELQIRMTSKLFGQCRIPGHKPVATGGAVARLTDHTKYMGTHKQRFDEAGKGRGKEGRQDVPSESGYVSGYKDEGNYNKRSRTQRPVRKRRLAPTWRPAQRASSTSRCCGPQTSLQEATLHHARTCFAAHNAAF